MAGDSVFPEIKKRFIPFHGIMGLAVHDRDRARVFASFLVQPGDQLVKLFQVRIIARLSEGINQDGMNLASLRSPGFFPGCNELGRRCLCARRWLIHWVMMVSGSSESKHFMDGLGGMTRWIRDGSADSRVRAFLASD